MLQDTGKPEMITVAVVIFVAVLTAFCKSELFNKIITEKLSLTGKGYGNPDSQSNSLKEKKEYYKERFSYISYTAIYFSVIFLFFGFIGGLSVRNSFIRSFKGDIQVIWAERKGRYF